MKNIMTYISVLVVLVFISVGCGTGRIDEGSEEVLSFSEPDGVAISGTADPGKDLLVTFNVDVSNVSGSMVCSNGSVLDIQNARALNIEIVQVASNQVLIKHLDGSFPQVSVCNVYLTSGSSTATTQAVNLSKQLASFNGEVQFGCGLSDDFTNQYALSCWDHNSYVSSDIAFTYLSDSLLISMMADPSIFEQEGEPDLSFSQFSYLSKRVSGDFEVRMSGEAGYQLSDEDDAMVGYYLIAVPDVSVSPISTVFTTGYLVMRADTDVYYQTGVQTFLGGGGLPDDQYLFLNEDDPQPLLSIIKTGNVYRARYSLDGETWSNFGKVDFDMGDDFAGPVDVVIFVFGNQEAIYYADSVEFDGGELVE